MTDSSVQCRLSYGEEKQIPVGQAVRMMHKFHEINRRDLIHIINEVRVMLRKHGFIRTLVTASGDISPKGARKDGQDWKLGVTHPQALARYFKVLQTTNSSITTSGDYENAFTSDNTCKYIIDPCLDHSPRELASAIVIANDTATANALATSAMVLGTVDALHCSNRYKV